MTNQGKLLIAFRDYLGWALKSMSQISQYLFIAILCAKMLCVNWA